MDNKRLRLYVRSMILSAGRSTKVNMSTGPSRRWIIKFRQEFNIVYRSAENVSKGKTKLPRSTIVHFHSLLRNLIEELGITEATERLFNADETGFTKDMQKRKAKVLARVLRHLQPFHLTIKEKCHSMCLLG